MKVVLTGATGFIGSKLVARLLDAGHEITALGRKKSANLPASVRFTSWESSSEPSPESLEGAHAIVNLAGEPVAQRWNAEVKRRIRASRVEGTRNLVQALAKLSARPSILINASAIGYYGHRNDEMLTESSAPGADFLASVTRDWELAAEKAGRFGTRVAKLRIGIVLGRQGALAQMLPVFRAGIGGRLGSGRQWMSWIHIDDLVSLILFALDNPETRGALNGTAPNPVRNAEFSLILGEVLHRPAIFPTPAILIKAMFGEMSTVILASQRVLPEAALAAGFHFKYPELKPALAEILR